MIKIDNNINILIDWLADYFLFILVLFYHVEQHF